MKSRIAFWVMLTLVIASVGLNVYQMHMFATADLSTPASERLSQDLGRENSAPNTGFVLNIDLLNDGYKPTRSYPFWVKEGLGGALNINISQFDSLIKTYCFSIDSSGEYIRNCIDKLQVWIIPTDIGEEAFVSMTGSPVDTASIRARELCANQVCRSFRLLHFSREKKKTRVVGDSGYKTIEVNEQNLNFTLLKLSQGGISGWLRSVDWFDDDLATTDVSLHLSTGKNIIEAARIPVKGSWVDAECMSVDTDTEKMKFPEECTKGFSSELITNFEQSPHWSPADLRLTNTLNAKGTPLNIKFDRETNKYLLPDQVSPGIKDLLTTLRYRPELQDIQDSGESSAE
jgi:hypothetical protein